MAYRVYLTLEMPGDYPTLDRTQAAAVSLMQWGAVSHPLGEGERFIQARVMEQANALSLKPPAFVVDICDGCI